MPPLPIKRSMTKGPSRAPGCKGVRRDDATERRRRRQHLEHFAAQRRIRALFRDESVAIRGRELGGVGEQRLRTFPRRPVHPWPFMRRPSQNLAAAISRRIVAGDSAFTVATSASVKPPK